MNQQEPHDPNDFLRESESQRTSIVSEFIDFLKHNKKWWLLPILIVMVLLIGLVTLVMVSPAAAPFIYTLF
ncbi:MAG: hypothetical protein IPK83_06665 [Planctomycetes bacterium]|nr:hypothetical protein [Planctomycetota bacterium]